MATGGKGMIGTRSFNGIDPSGVTRLLFTLPEDGDYHFKGSLTIPSPVVINGIDYWSHVTVGAAKNSSFVYVGNMGDKSFNFTVSGVAGDEIEIEYASDQAFDLGPNKVQATITMEKI